MLKIEIAIKINFRIEIYVDIENGPLNINEFNS